MTQKHRYRVEMERTAGAGANTLTFWAYAGSPEEAERLVHKHRRRIIADSYRTTDIVLDELDELEG